MKHGVLTRSGTVSPLSMALSTALAVALLGAFSTAALAVNLSAGSGSSGVPGPQGPGVVWRDANGVFVGPLINREGAGADRYIDDSGFLWALSWNDMTILYPMRYGMEMYSLPDCQGASGGYLANPDLLPRSVIQVSTRVWIAYEDNSVSADFQAQSFLVWGDGCTNIGAPTTVRVMTGTPIYLTRPQITFRAPLHLSRQ